jgi:hypothetical protein
MIKHGPVILDKLRAELSAANIIVLGMVSRATPDGVDVSVVDADGHPKDLPAQARAVLDAHDGTPPVKPVFGGDVVDIQDQAAQIVTGIRNYIRDVQDPGVTITAARRQQFEVIIGKAVLHYIRSTVQE